MPRKHRLQTPPLAAIYTELYQAWGPQHWWPARTRFEMIVGAILTQNTAWSNVERALSRLRKVGALRPATLHHASIETIAEWIRPSGYYNMKAKRLKAFTTLLFEQFDGKLNRLFALETAALRQILLDVNGIGPETADSILLYAAQRSQFVIDAYTKRFLVRHNWINPSATYDDIAALFHRQLPPDVPHYNEYHALIVYLGKTYCRTKPDCANCPLRHRLPRS